MSIFSEKKYEALATGKYICAKCGAEMIFEDKWEEKLACPKCGYKVDAELYGIESEEEYEALYPIVEMKGEPPRVRRPEEDEETDKK